MDSIKNLPPELQITSAMVSEYNILGYKLSYSHAKLGTATYEVTAKTGNYLLKLISPNSQKIVPNTNSGQCQKYAKLLKSTNLLALKCSQFSAFPKIVAHKTVNDVLQILMIAPGKKLIDYVSHSEGIKFKDLISIFSQLINTIFELSRASISHHIISLKAIYITPTKNIIITEILPDLASFITYQDAISGEEGLQLPPEIWEEGSTSKKDLTLPGHIYIIGHYFLKLITWNPKIVTFTENVASGQIPVLSECLNDQLTIILDLITRMVDGSMQNRPNIQDLLFYFKLFSLGNSGIASQICIFLYLYFP